MYTRRLLFTATLGAFVTSALLGGVWCAPKTEATPPAGDGEWRVDQHRCHYIKTENQTECDKTLCCKDSDNLRCLVASAELACPAAYPDMFCFWCPYGKPPTTFDSIATKPLINSEREFYIIDGCTFWGTDVNTQCDEANNEVVCCNDDKAQECIAWGDGGPCIYDYPAAFCRLCISKQSLQAQDLTEKRAFWVGMAGAIAGVVAIVVSVVVACCECCACCKGPRDLLMNWFACCCRRPAGRGEVHGLPRNVPYFPDAASADKLWVCQLKLLGSSQAYEACPAQDTDVSEFQRPARSAADINIRSDAAARRDQLKHNDTLADSAHSR